MTRRVVLVLAGWIALLAPAVRAGDSVLYSVTTSDAGTIIPVTKTQLSKTEIFAVDLETGKQRLVFSDANAHFILLPGGSRRGGIVAERGRIFAEGTDPVQSAAHTPKFDPSAPAAMYELSTDGSGQARKVFDMGGAEERVNLSKPFFNSSGSEFANISYVEGKWYLLVHDTETLKLLRKVYLRYGTGERLGWRYGSIENIGWMADDKRFFFTIALAGDSDDAWWTAPNSPVGTYVLNEDAEIAQRLAPEAALHPKIAGMEPSNDSPAVLIGTLPDGGYLLQDHEGDSSGRGGAYLYELDLTKKMQRIFPLHVDGSADSFHLSRSGDRLAWMDTQKEMKKQPMPAAVATLTVWVMELGSGKQMKLVSFPPYDETHNADGPWINLIGWLGEK